MNQSMCSKILTTLVLLAGGSLVCPMPVMASDYSAIGGIIFYCIPTAIILFGYGLYVIMALINEKYDCIEPVCNAMVISGIMMVLVYLCFWSFGSGTHSLLGFFYMMLAPFSGPQSLENIPSWLIIGIGPRFIFCFICFSPVIQYWVLRRCKNQGETLENE